MTWWIVALIIVGDYICMCLGFAMGWRRGFDAAEKIWEPACTMLHNKFKDLMRDLLEPPPP